MAIERAPELERLLLDAYQAVRHGDGVAIERLVSHHESALAVGTDAGEVWRGHDAIVKELKAAGSQRGEGDPRFEPGHPEGYKLGDVGWVVDQGQFRLADGSELPARIMAVMHREAGEWRILHSTSSLAVPNSALEPGSPVVQALAPAVR